MQVFVYRSRRKADTYLYLDQRDAFSRLPAALHDALAPFDFALEFELTPQRRLARVTPEVVRANLAGHGYHLQLPPPDPITHDVRRHARD